MFYYCVLAIVYSVHMDEIRVAQLYRGRLVVNTCVILDFFRDECTEDAAEECSELRREVPASKQFNSTAFKQYCR